MFKLLSIFRAHNDRPLNGLPILVQWRLLTSLFVAGLELDHVPRVLAIEPNLYVTDRLEEASHGGLGNGMPLPRILAGVFQPYSVIVRKVSYDDVGVVRLSQSATSSPEERLCLRLSLLGSLELPFE